MEGNWWATATVTFTVTLMCAAFLRPLAFRCGLVDCPSGRKQHEGNIPLIGGHAMFLGLCTALWLLPGTIGREDLAICGAGALLLLLGTLDDFSHMSVRWRLLGQCAAAMLLTLGAPMMLHDLGAIISPTHLHLGPFAWPVTLFCYVGVINAMNMIDGLDGLASGLSLVTLSALIWLGSASGSHLQLLIPVAGAVAGFLVLNVRPGARPLVFMGDAGSMLLGGIVAALLIGMSQGPAHPLSPATALWIFAIPLMDTIRVIIHRYLTGRSPFHPGRDHIHHVLLRRGLSHHQTGTVIMTMAVLCAVIGVSGQHLALPERHLFLAFLLTFLAYAVIVSLAARPRLVGPTEHRPDVPSTGENPPPTRTGSTVLP